MTHFTEADPYTIACQDRDFPEWHRGRERYGIWMIDADIAPLRERIGRAREHLDGLLTQHLRPPHITLFVCGFVAEAVTLDDDFDAAMLQTQRRALHELDTGTFRLNIGGLDSFDSAVFLCVEDTAGALKPLRAALGRGSKEIRQAPYVAHLTVGFYRNAFDKREVSQRLSCFTDSAPIELHVERLHFVSYAARELGGPFESVETLTLLQAAAGNNRSRVISEGAKKRSGGPQ